MKLIIEITDSMVCNDIQNKALEPQTETDKVIIDALYNGIPYEERPHGEYVDISKLRLMTVEECAGHTIDYAMGWKACIEWIKKGGADMRKGDES